MQLEPYAPYPPRIARDVPLAQMLDFLGGFAFADRETLEAHATILDLLWLQEQNPAATVAVIVMKDPATPRNRTLRPDGGFPLFQGAGGGGYPGDDAIFVPDRPTIQVHWVHVNGESAPRVPAVAIRLPDGRQWLVQRKRRPA